MLVLGIALVLVLVNATVLVLGVVLAVTVSNLVFPLAFIFLFLTIGSSLLSECTSVELESAVLSRIGSDLLDLVFLDVVLLDVVLLGDLDRAGLATGD